MKKRPLFLALVALPLAAVIGLSGCGTTHTAALDRARTAYTQAQANPTVTSNAPVTLYEAGQSLQKAEQADNEEQQQHYAYLAQKQTEQAVYEANQKAAQQQIARAGQERQQVLLEAREQEAARARSQAMAARQQAQTAEERARIAQEQQAMATGQAQAYQQQAMAARQQAQMARQQAGQLESQLSELNAKQTSQGNVMLTMSDVMFEFDKAALKPGAMLSLDKLADILKQNPNEKVYIEGHTDSTGSAPYNQQLSTARANAVRDALVQRGVSPDRIIARGLGESFPVASNDTQGGRQLNRRVDIVVTG